jgi:hypothetical protein
MTWEWSRSTNSADLNKEVKEIAKPKAILSTMTPTKDALFQITRMPPKAPKEGMKSSISNG